jgi:hypothetical protein
MAIQTGDIAASILNEPASLQADRSLCDAEPSNAKHEGSKLLREVRVIGVRAILGH